MEDDMQTIREVMEEPDRICEHEYLPEDDGTVFTCGSDFDVAYLSQYGMHLCLQHRHQYFKGDD